MLERHPDLAANTPAFRLMSATAEMLFTHGQTTQATHRAVERLSAALDCPVTLLMRWDETVLRSVDGRQVFRSFDSPAVVDMGLVAATSAVVDAVCDGRMDCDAADKALNEIRHQGATSAWRFACMAAVGAGAMGVIFGAADVLSIALIALSAAVGALLRKAVAQLSPNTFVPPFVAALAAGAFAGAINLAVAGAPMWLLLVCPCMALMPGPHLLNGSMDMVRGRLVLGSARIAFALMVILMICSGFLLGLSLFGSAFPSEPARGVVPLLVDVLAAGFAVAAFGSFFSMPWRLLPIPIVIGMLGHALRWSLLDAGSGPATGAFVTSLLVGALMTPLAERLRMPFAALGFASVVSLIPGVYLFELASGLVAATHGSGAQVADLRLLQNASTALLVALAITAGLMLPRLAWDVLTARAFPHR